MFLLFDPNLDVCGSRFVRVYSFSRPSSCFSSDALTVSSHPPLFPIFPSHAERVRCSSTYSTPTNYLFASSSSNMLSDSHFARVVYALRVADAHCFSEARNIRAAYRPTFHAKNRSIRLGLCVDTDKAARLPVSHVSTKPYPLVVQTYSPVIESTTRVTTIRLNGPTASDLLILNAALVEYIARVDKSTMDDDRLMYPSTACYDDPANWRSKPDVPSDITSLRSSNRSSRTSASSDVLITPVRILHHSFDQMPS